MDKIREKKLIINNYYKRRPAADLSGLFFMVLSEAATVPQPSNAGTQVWL